MTSPVRTAESSLMLEMKDCFLANETLRAATCQNFIHSCGDIATALLLCTLQHRYLSLACLAVFHQPLQSIHLLDTDSFHFFQSGVNANENRIAFDELSWNKP